MKISFLLVFLFLVSWDVQAANDPMCEDLYSAACGDSKGKNKFQDEEAKRVEEAKKVVQEAQDLGAKSMGYKNLEDGIKNRLKELGIEPSKSADEKAWKDVRKGISASQASEIFETPSQCSKVLADVENERMTPKSNPEKIKAVMRKFKDTSKKTIDANISISAKDLSQFMTFQVGENCRKLEKESDRFKPEDNKQMVQICERMPELRRQYVQLYRKEGSAGYKEESEKFVRDNWPVDLQQSSGQQAKKQKANPAWDQLVREYDKLISDCNASKHAFQVQANNSIQEFMTEVNTSKPAIEHLHGKYFTEANWKKASQLFDAVRVDLQDIAKQITPSKEKQNRITEEYSQIELKWMEKPESSLYKEGPNGVPVLDEEKLQNSSQKYSLENTYAKFSDPELNFFQELNANYQVSLKNGDKQNKERIEMMPAYLMTMETTPWRFISVLAHEFGHKIDPNESGTNGHDLSNEYKEILACFSDPKSIKMAKNQKGETIADYLSSEYMARQLMKMTPDQRRRTLIQAVEPDCLADSMKSHLHFIECTGNHPENSLRISGIVGANPNIRKAIGCEGPSSQYRTCGMSNIRLPEVSADSRIPKQTNPVRIEKGVE